MNNNKKFYFTNLIQVAIKQEILDRFIALEILNHLFIENKMSSDFFLKNEINLSKVRPEKLAHANRLAKSVIKNLPIIDHQISLLVKKRPSKVLLNILRIATLEILIENIPPHASVDNAVKLAKIKMKDKYSVAFINAVLRSFSKKDLSKINPSNFDHNLENKTELADYCIKIYGREIQKKIWQAFRNEPITDVTVKNKSELKKWEKLLGGKRIGNSNTLRLQKIGKVSEMPGYKEGAWWVQNFSASLPVLLLGNIENLQVIDCCAAPGGKTMQLISGGASTTSIDRSKRRVETLKQNLERTKLNSKIIISDILDFTPKIPYDVVLLDAPCSSTGTLRKNPEIEYLDPISRIKTFSEVQKRLLNHVSNWVKPGGNLVFSTCSISPEEGERIISVFLGSNKNYSVEKLNHNDLGLKQSLTDCLGGIRLNPNYLIDIGGVDGFYIAILKKQKA